MGASPSPAPAPRRASC